MPHLLPGATLPPGYAETHSITRTEVHRATLDQVGSGSAGTFTIDVVGSASSVGSASGDGEYAQYPTLAYEANGGGSNTLTYHLVRGGTYANGTFTITSEVYTETRSFTLTQDYAQTTSSEYGWYRTSWDTTRAGTSTLSYTAAADENGALAYTSYSLASAETATWHQRSEYSFGGYTDTLTTSASGGTIEWDGTAAVRVGSRNYGVTTTWYYPNPSGEPNTGSNSSGWTEPVSDTVSLPSLWSSTADWEWNAPSDATGFTFHGVGVDSGTLTETARYTTPDGATWVFEVLDFDVTSHMSKSAHTVYDDPGVDELGGGTTEFHRDELFAWANDVTGDGSYLDGATDATYQAVQTSDYTIGNNYTLTGSETSGTNEEEESFDLFFNYSRASSGGGTYTTTYDYHDAGDGVELVNSTYTHSATSTVTTREWGTNTGVAYDATTVSIEPISGSFSMLGNPGAVTTADGLVGAIPFRSFTIPHNLFYVQTPNPIPVPTTPVGGTPGQIQSWYNDQIQRIGGGTAVKVTHQAVVRAVLFRINDTENGQTPRASGSFNYPSGVAFSQGLGLDGWIAERDAHWRQTFRQLGYSDIELPGQGGLTVDITYAVHQASSNPRSGNIVAEYRMVFTYQATNRAGQRLTVVRKEAPRTIVVHSPQLERMTIQP